MTFFPPYPIQIFRGAAKITRLTTWIYWERSINLTCMSQFLCEKYQSPFHHCFLSVSSYSIQIFCPAAKAWRLNKLNPLHTLDQLWFVLWTCLKNIPSQFSFTPLHTPLPNLAALAAMGCCDTCTTPYLCSPVKFVKSFWLCWCSNIPPHRIQIFCGAAKIQRLTTRIALEHGLNLGWKRWNLFLFTPSPHPLLSFQLEQNSRVQNY